MLHTGLNVSCGDTWCVPINQENSLNKTGTRVETWGTPQIKRIWSEVQLLISYFLSLRHDLNYSRAALQMHSQSSSLCSGIIVN